jgi:hypothetical protein
MENSDSTEGKGHMVAFAHFLDQRDANIAVRGRGVMGCSDGEVRELWVYESIADWEEGEEEKLRQAALSKLSNEEVKALGIKHQRKGRRQ